MPVQIVQSKQNSRLKELRRTLAHPGRSPHGLVGIEGPNLLAEALRAGLHIRCAFAAQGSEHLLDALALPPDVEVLLLPAELLVSALATETPQPVAALVEPVDWIWRDILEPANSAAPLVVILAGLQDPGNLGAILRSAEAFGATGVVALPGTVSAWNPKAVRASAGSVFRVPLMQSTAPECLPRLRESGITVFTTAVRNAVPAPGANLTQPAAFLIGNEGSGVPPELAALADGAITIPCPGPVESLNASIAASILLYEASRQRGGKP